jgi:RNA polymerase sigma-70 factor (ECF subfamily)
MLGNREDAEEATQDVFLNIHRNLADFRGESSISTWIYRITYNICLRRREQMASQNRVFSESADRDAEFADESPDAHEIIAKREMSVLLQEAIAQLPTNEAAVITLLYLEEKTYAEIGEILSMPAGTVATSLHRGRNRLRSIIKEMEDDMRSM